MALVTAVFHSHELPLLALAARQLDVNGALRLHHFAKRCVERKLPVRLERPLRVLSALVDNAGDVVRGIAHHIVIRATDVTEAVDRQIEHSRAHIAWSHHDGEYAEGHPITARGVNDVAG